MNDLKDKIANRQIPADHQACADSQYLQFSQNYLDHIEQLNVEVSKGLQATLRSSQSLTDVSDNEDNNKQQCM
jgi:hypothetical protein